jgi:hypothetical protein
MMLSLRKGVKGAYSELRRLHLSTLGGPTNALWLYHKCVNDFRSAGGFACKSFSVGYLANGYEGAGTIVDFVYVCIRYQADEP